MDGILDEEVTLSWCPAPHACRTLARFPVGAHAPDSSVSPDARFAVVEELVARDRETLTFYDLSSGTAIGQASLDGGGTSNTPSLETRWTAGGHLLRTWGAGSGVAVGTLYSADGHVLLDFTAPAIEVSPDLRFLLEYEPDDGAVADQGTFAVYDLAAGRALNVHVHDLVAVLSIRWGGRDVTIDYRSALGATRTATFALDGH